MIKKTYIDIVGNGVIGMLSAILIKKNFPKLEVRLFGNKEQRFSASIAAGAMVAVYGEVEDNPNSNNNQKNMLEMSLKGSEGWLKFIKNFKLSKKIITAQNTCIYLKKNCSDFENKIFEIVKNISLEDKKSFFLKKEEIKKNFFSKQENIESVLKIKNEYSICTEYLFDVLKKLIQNLKILEINENLKKVVRDNNKIILISDKNKYFYSDKVVIAAGAHSSQLFNKQDRIMQTLQGVGSALIINNVKNIPKIFGKEVIRTVNRGGAQCGIHTVPRTNGKIYLGAGNYVIKSSQPFHRFETIKYLYETFDNELLGREISYKLTGSFVLGSRPRSLDGFPMIGTMQNDNRIFFATGTNRLGLTWAPKIVEEIINWINEKNISMTLKDWSPDRKLIKFGSKKECIEYFVASRLANRVEHNLMDSNDYKSYKTNRDQILKYSKITLKKVNKKLNIINKNYSINPDNWNALVT